MYKVIRNGSTVAYSDTLVWIRLHQNGSYVQTEQSQADGFCVKVPVLTTDEETGESIQMLQDVVYALEPGGLHGTEPVASLDVFSGAISIQEQQEILDIMTGVSE